MLLAPSRAIRIFRLRHTRIHVDASILLVFATILLLSITAWSAAETVCTAVTLLIWLGTLFGEAAILAFVASSYNRECNSFVLWPFGVLPNFETVTGAFSEDVAIAATPLVALAPVALLSATAHLILDSAAQSPWFIPAADWKSSTFFLALCGRLVWLVTVSLVLHCLPVFPFTVGRLYVLWQRKRFGEDRFVGRVLIVLGCISVLFVFVGAVTGAVAIAAAQPATVLALGLATALWLSSSVWKLLAAHRSDVLDEHPLFSGALLAPEGGLLNLSSRGYTPLGDGAGASSSTAPIFSAGFAADFVAALGQCVSCGQLGKRKTANHRYRDVEVLSEEAMESAADRTALPLAEYAAVPKVVRDVYFIQVIVVATCVLVLLGQTMPSFEARVWAVAEKTSLLDVLESKLRGKDTVSVGNISFPISEGPLKADVNLVNVTCDTEHLKMQTADLIPAGLTSINVSISGFDLRCNVTALVTGTSITFHETVLAQLELTGGIVVSLAVRKAQIGKGAVKLNVSNCDPHMRPQLSFEGTAPILKQLLNLLRSRIESSVETAIDRQLCPIIQRIMSPDDASALSRTAQLTSRGAVTRSASMSPTVFLLERQAFSIFEGIRKLFELHEVALASLLLLFSGIWPYVKLGLVSLCWGASLQRSQTKRIVAVLEYMGKWSMLDVVFVALLLIVLDFSFESRFAKGALSVVPLSGIYVYCAAVIVSLGISSYIGSICATLPKGPPAFADLVVSSIHQPGTTEVGPTVHETEMQEAEEVWGLSAPIVSAPQRRLDSGPPEYSEFSEGSDRDDLAADLDLAMNPTAEDELSIDSDADLDLHTQRAPLKSRLRVLTPKSEFTLRVVLTAVSLGAAVLAVLTTFLPLYSMSKTITISVLGVTDQWNSNSTGSLLTTAIGRSHGTLRLEDIPGGAALQPWATPLTKPLLKLVILVFAIIVPFLKYASLLSCWLGWFRVDCCPMQLRAILKRIQTLLTLFFPWDMRDVLVGSLLILSLRVTPMVSAISTGYCAFSMHFKAPLCVLSCITVFFVCLSIPLSVSSCITVFFVCLSIPLSAL